MSCAWLAWVEEVGAHPAARCVTAAVEIADARSPRKGPRARPRRRRGWTARFSHARAGEASAAFRRRLPADRLSALELPSQQDLGRLGAPAIRGAHAQR